MGGQGCGEIKSKEAFSKAQLKVKAKVLIQSYASMRIKPSWNRKLRYTIDTERISLKLERQRCAMLGSEIASEHVFSVQARCTDCETKTQISSI